MNSANQAMHRIMIIGCSGAGKSTLARQLGDILQLPVHHLDRLFWRPGWVETPRDEWINIQRQLFAAPQWIIDGNYGGTMDLRLTACDTVIFLDYARRVCLWRAVKRLLIHRRRVRPDMTAGCPERITGQFLRWIWRYRRDRRPGILAQLSKLQDQKSVIMLSSPKAADRFLEKIRRPGFSYDEPS